MKNSAWIKDGLLRGRIYIDHDASNKVMVSDDRWQTGS